MPGEVKRAQITRIVAAGLSSNTEPDVGRGWILL